LNFGWDKIEATLNEHVPLISAFQDRIEKLFSTMIQSKLPPFTRRPPVGLRLICSDDPPAKLIVSPTWNRDMKTFSRGSSTVFEFFLEQPLGKGVATDLNGNPIDMKRLTKALVFNIDFSQRIRLRTIRMKDAELDVQRVLKVMADFNADIRVVLARSHEACCCCGRRLTDGRSRARGIGPECIKTMMLVPCMDWNQLVAEELVQA
jgi:hypothetical protein